MTEPLSNSEYRDLQTERTANESTIIVGISASGDCRSSQRRSTAERNSCSHNFKAESHKSHTKAPYQISDKLSRTISITQRNPKRGMQKAENKISTLHFYAEQYLLYQITRKDHEVF
jgi:hypothetical protein